MGGMQQDIIKVYVKFPEAVQLLGAGLVMTAGSEREVHAEAGIEGDARSYPARMSVEKCTVCFSGEP